MATKKQLKYWESLKGKCVNPQTAFKKGEHRSPSTQFKKGQNMGNKNSSWKGDKAGYHAMHKWIQKHLIKPQTCRDCNKPEKLELANISGKYLRDISDWEWLCHFCNLNKDARNRKENGRLTAKQFLMQEGRKLP